MNTFGPQKQFLRVSAASHAVHIADPDANCQSLKLQLDELRESGVVVFGELSLSGYSCADLFGQDQLLDQSLAGLLELAEATVDRPQLVVVGLPLRVNGRLYNVGAALHDGHVLGIVPKQFLPNYHEFYEARWFDAADGREPEWVELGDHGDVPFGIDLLFRSEDLTVGIELCEDLWMPVPPSSLQAMAGAQLLLNLSASNEIVGKADWRRTLVKSHSGRCLAAYAYASAGPRESSTDVVFGGHCMVFENGMRLAESHYVGEPGCGWVESAHATAEVDLQRLGHDRLVTNSWQQASKRAAVEVREVEFGPVQRSDGSQRVLPGRPFVPNAGSDRDRRCSEIFGIQCAALAKRLQQLPPDTPLNIGVSGGLDSTLALLVAVKTCQLHQWPQSRIHGITMPGFGTTDHTLTSSRQLMQLLGITSSEIDIRQLCLDTFRALGHQPFGINVNSLGLAEFTQELAALPEDKLHDLVFENVQARMRTLVLMNRGFVLGTGDLSEQALGWSTYNGDHMSMYNVNTSIPKTLVRFLVQYVADQEFDGEARDCLHRVVETPITPELLPVDAEGQLRQSTEESIGDYELHDFFLYHTMRFGTAPERILHLASLAEFTRAYSESEIRSTLIVFLKRFFANQFKRSCVPDGPKVGSVSLSPRGDWRMPSDAEVGAWIRDLERES